MDAKETTLLKEIRTIYDKLEQNVYGEYRGSIKIGEPGFCYDIHAKELSNKVLELYNTFQPEYLSLSEIGDFMHTMDKEVAFVVYDYQESIKPRVSQKKKNEVCKAINKANEQIKLDLFRLFRKIDELQ